MCVVNPQLSNGQSLTSFFDFNTFELWTYDVQRGYLVLAGAAVAAIVLSFIFLCLLRCCTKIIIWVSIALVLLFLCALGVMMILQSQGIHVSQYLPFDIAALTQTVLIIVGSCLLGAALLFFVIVLCLGSRISMGAAVVETASIFLREQCLISLMPIVQTLFFVGSIAALLVGLIYLYSIGQQGPPLASKAFVTVTLDTSLIVMISFFSAGGLWTIFWIHGSNHFVVSSSACIWYFNHDEYAKGPRGRPFCDSIGRLLRYHPGTVAFASLLFALFFILRLLAQLFSFKN